MDRRTFAAGALAAAGMGPAATAQVPNPATREIDNWSEIVGLVPRGSRAAAFWREVAQWRVVERGEVPRPVLRLWGVPDTEEARHTLFRPRGEGRQGVRIVELSPGRLPRGRINAQPWDTGGVFSVMVRARSLDTLLDLVPRHGYGAFSEPYDLSFGGRTLRNTVLRAPDGVHVAVYERVGDTESSPPTGFARAFNSMQMVADRDRAEAWYTALGWRTVVRGTFIDPGPTLTNFAIPPTLATSVPRHYAIMVPREGEELWGRIELMQFEGFGGTDLAPVTARAALGWSTLVFPVRDLTALRARLPAGVTIAAEGDGRSAGALLDGRITASLMLVSPDGARITFAQG
jgi:catechol 2,3-dioxygenase-like lactoylglutathione lyase family enzyme